MTISRWWMLNVTLMTLFFLVPAMPQTKDPSKPDSSTPVINVERRTPDEGMTITRYHDLSSGRMLIVKGGTESGTARAWLASLVQIKAANEGSYLSQMKELFKTHQPSGMLSLAIFSDGVRLSVYSGALPDRTEVVNINAQDIQSGTSVKVDSIASQEDALAWLRTARKADSEAGFAALIDANHSKGLTGISFVRDGILIETLWQRK